jgi:hypothetical protein
MTELPVHAYFPLGRSSRLAARAFVDFLAAELSEDPQHFHAATSSAKSGATARR